MKTAKYLLALTSVALLCASMTWADDMASDKDKSDIDKRIDKSGKVLEEIMATPDKGIPDEIMKGAKCVAVVPSMIKIAVGFGGSHGKGVATCRTEHGWSAPAPFSITGGSWGLQLGGEAVDLVMIFTNHEGMEHLMASHVKLGADASAAAGPVGRAAGADTDASMRAEVLTYSRSRGLFAGINLSGAGLTQDKDETRLLYGKIVPFRAILTGTVPAPAASEPFLSVVKRYSMEVKNQAENVSPK